MVDGGGKRRTEDRRRGGRPDLRIGVKCDTRPTPGRGMCKLQNADIVYRYIGIGGIMAVRALERMARGGRAEMLQ